MTDPYIHVDYCTEPQLPPPGYMDLMEEMLSLRAGHLPIGASAGPWLLHPMIMEKGSDDYEHHMWRGLPIPRGVYMGLFHGKPTKNTVWMSDVPPEIWSMRDAIAALKEPENKRVLITGLGLGIILEHARRQPHIKRIDVVEKDADVIRLVRHHYRGRHVHVHHGDAHTIDLGPRRTWDYGYHDIWKDITAANLPDMVRLERRWKDRVGHQDFWEREGCERHLRREAESRAAMKKAYEGYRELVGRDV